jgi:hypothetical protein
LSIDGINGIEINRDNGDLKKVENKNSPEGTIIGIGIVNTT